MSLDCSCKKTDRYVSFIGIDCKGKALQIIECIDRHRAIAGHNTAFWDYFAKNAPAKAAPSPTTCC